MERLNPTIWKIEFKTKRQKDGRKEHLQDLRCCERDEGKKKKRQRRKEREERKRKTLCLEQPWYLENQPLEFSAAASLFGAGSENTGSFLISTRMNFFSLHAVHVAKSLSLSLPESWGCSIAFGDGAAR